MVNAKLQAKIDYKILILVQYLNGYSFALYGLFFYNYCNPSVIC